MLRTLSFLLVAIVFSSGVFAKDIKIAVSQTTLDYFPELVDVVLEAFTNAGHSVTSTTLPGERAVAMLASGEIDADAMRLANFNETVPDAIPVRVVLTNLPLVAVIKTDSTFTGKSDLVGKRMALTRGIKVHNVIASQMNVKTSEQSNFEASAKMVAAGRADFVPATMDIAQSFINAGLAVKVLEEPLMEIPFFTWVSAGNADIVPGLEKELQALKDAGRF